MKAWLHRRGTPIVWEFIYDSKFRRYFFFGSSNIYYIVHRKFLIKILAISKDGSLEDVTRRIRAESIELANGDRYVFARKR